MNHLNKIIGFLYVAIVALPLLLCSTQDAILKEHLMAIADIKERLQAFDGDIQSSIRKIMHNK